MQRTAKGVIMRCPNCGAEYEPGDTFCRTCGSSFPTYDATSRPAAFCSECGAAITLGQSFCPSCGTPTSNASSYFEATAKLPKSAVAPVQYTPAGSIRAQQTPPRKYMRIGLGLGIVILIAALAIGGVLYYNTLIGNEPAPAITVQTGSVAVTSFDGTDAEDPAEAQVTDVAHISEDSGSKDGDTIQVVSNPFGVGGTYDVDSTGLVTNKTYMFKFRIPEGYEGEMLTNNTILFRGDGFTVTIDAWYNEGESDESRYRNASNSLVEIDYETKSDGLFVVSGRDSRGHDMYTKEIIEPDRICRMVVDSEVSPCSSACEQATIDFEGEFRLLR